MEEKKNYFTEEIREQIRTLTNEDMRHALKSLEGTVQWFAIIKYTQDRIASIQDSFLTLDPIKDSVKMARYQGAITGMLDLQDAVLTLIYENKKVENNPKYKTEVNKDDLGGAYGAI